METWGELFWDAWIRLRLACRRLYRTYWPPQVKAWQVCTVTGVASIILTMVVLNLSEAKNPSPADKKKESVADKSQAKKPLKALAKAKVDAEDPFADEALTSTSDELLNDESSGPPAQAVTFDPDEVVTTKKRGKARSKSEETSDFTIADAADQSAVAQDATSEEMVSDTISAIEKGTDSTEAGATEAGTTEAAATGAEPTMADTTFDQPADEFQPTLAKETPKASADEAVPPLNGGVPSVEESEQPAAKETGPALELPKRDADHYLRDHHEAHEEGQAEGSNVKVTRLNGVPAKRHTPFITDVHPKGHYSRMGHKEDEEEDRHSVQDIRATRTDGVPVPGARIGNLGVTPAPAPTQPERVGGPVTPPVTKPPVTQETEVAPTEPATEAVPSDFEKTEEPAAAVATEKPIEDPVEPQSTRVLPEVDEPEASEPPPVLIAPEPEPEAAPAGDKYQGPVQSTAPSDHEAHEEEDAFSRLPRKPATKSDWPEDFPVAPATGGVEQPATDAAPAADKQESVEPMEEAPPAVEQPAEEAETTTTTSRRPAPRVFIPHDDEPQPTQEEPGPEQPVQDQWNSEPENPHLDEDRVLPMAVPEESRPPMQERITIPDRVEPVEAPPATQDSEFTVARPAAPAPRLVMEITGPKQVPLGTQAILHFRVQNVGNAPATGIVVSDVLPAGLQHKLSADLEYIVPRLDPGESKETNLTVQCIALGTITNKATLRADGDATTAAEISLEVVKPSARRGTAPPPPESPLALRHHGPERWLLDSTGQFLITVTNTSKQTLKNVTITQTFPQGTNLVHATIGNKYDPKSQSLTWTIDEFAPGISYILETELHSMTSGPTTTVARIKVGNDQVAEDRWTAVSYDAIASKPRQTR